MNKQELLENYTMEQIADMVVDVTKLAEANTILINKKNEENKRLSHQLDRKETEIAQIDDILNELFGVTHDITSKPDEFKKILREKIESSKTLADFLPKEPIKVADMLINTEVEYEHNSIEKALYKTDKGTYNLFGISELRQIAEHLLVYCNANESEGE